MFPVFLAKALAMRWRIAAQEAIQCLPGAKKMNDGVLTTEHEPHAELERPERLGTKTHHVAVEAS
jgi:hypothetical protein